MFGRRVAPASCGPVTSPQGRGNGNDVIVGVDEVTDKEQCAKAVHLLAREAATYHSMLLSLGAMGDGQLSRDALRDVRMRALALALQNKIKMLPHLRGTQRNVTDLEEFEKLWNEFSSCLELFSLDLSRTLRLTRRFPLCTDQTVLIDTGLLPSIKMDGDEQQTSTEESLVLYQRVDGSTSQQQQQQQQPEQDSISCSSLERDISSMSVMLREVHEIVDIKPWAIQSYTNPVKQPDLVASKNIRSVATDFLAIFREPREKRRKLCIAAMATTAVVVIASTVSGVTVTLLKH